MIRSSCLVRLKFGFGSHEKNTVSQNEMEFHAIYELIDLTGNLKLLNSHLYRSISLSNSRAQPEMNKTSGSFRFLPPPPKTSKNTWLEFLCQTRWNYIDFPLAERGRAASSHLQMFIRSCFCWRLCRKKTFFMILELFLFYSSLNIISVMFKEYIRRMRQIFYNSCEKDIRSLTLSWTVVWWTSDHRVEIFFSYYSAEQVWILRTTVKYVGVCEESFNNDEYT